MAIILNIETATDRCSVGISEAGKMRSLVEADEAFVHSKVITLLIEQALREAKIALSALDAVAVSQGPGSYTALRVGVSAAKGICFALDKPLIGIPTLQSIAYAAFEREQDPDALYCAMIDARRMEVYSQLFNAKNKAVTKLQSEVIDAQSYKNYFASEKQIVFAGNGAPKCQPIIQSPFARFSPVVCSAAHLAVLSQKSYEAKKFSDPAYFIPNYHKPPNITTPKKRVW